MHTFFINTSKRDFENYDVLFDIHRENKRLIPMQCDLDRWHDPEEGYAACVKSMSDVINSYTEITDTFQLIIYIDLTEIKQYTEKFAALDGEERKLYNQAVRMLFSQMVRDTIVKKLDNDRRRPQNTLLMFGVDKKMVTDETNVDDVYDHVYSCMGLPEKEKNADLLTQVKKDEKEKEKRGEMFYQKVVESISDSIVPLAVSCCDSYVNDFCVRLAGGDGGAEDCFKGAFSLLTEDLKDWNVLSVLCGDEYQAAQNNVRLEALIRLNIACYLLACVERNSVCCLGAGENNQPVAVPFVQKDSGDYADILDKKRRCYAKQDKTLHDLKGKYEALKLAPELHELKYDEYNLDGFGQKKPETCRDPLLTDLSLYTKKGNSFETKTSKLELKQHVDEIVHCYAGTSREGGKVKLTKRTISIPDDIYVEEKQKIRYEKEAQSKGAKPLKTVKDNMQRAYGSVLSSYFSACSGHALVSKDLTKHEDAYQDKTTKIEEDSHKTIVSFGCILAALAVLMFCFVGIQATDLSQNVVTVLTAVGAFFLPLLVAVVLFIPLHAKHYREEHDWAKKELDDNKANATKENDAAIEQYDMLLSREIPSLRHVYEYKLDVEFYDRCCAVAKAKVEHHEKKVMDRCTFVKSLMQDLDLSPRNGNGNGNGNNDDSFVDYAKPFCIDEKNINFYSVFNKEDLTALQFLNGEGR